MTSTFPGSLDSFNNPSSTDNLNTPGVLHSDQHANANDAIENIEAWVGASGTNQQASHEYRIKQLENTPPGGTAFGIIGQDEGVFVGTGTILNVVGEDISISRSGTVLQLTHTNPSISFPQPQIGLYLQDDGIALGTGTIINFVGANVDASLSGTVIRVFVTGTPPLPFPQEVIGVMGQMNGQSLGTGTILNVTGNGGTLSLSGTVLNLNLIDTQGGGGGSSSLVGQNKGVVLGTGTVINVTENDLTLSLSGSVFELSRTTGTTMYLGVDGTRVFGYRASGTWLVISNSPDPYDNIGVFGRSNGINLGTGTVIDFGLGMNASISGTTMFVHPFDNGTNGDAWVKITGSTQQAGWVNQDYNIQFHLGDGANTILTGSTAAGYGYVEVPVDSIIESWTIFGDATGSLTANLYKSTYAGFPPSALIAGLGQPKMTNLRKSTGNATGTASALKGDVMLIEISSVSTLKLATISLQCRKNATS